MATHENTQQAKHSAELIEAAMNSEAVKRASHTAVDNWRRWALIQEECARFAAKRVHRYQELFHNLSVCETPADAMKTYTHAFQQMFKDYSEEAGRMTSLSTNVLEDVIHSGEANGKATK